MNLFSRIFGSESNAEAIGEAITDEPWGLKVLYEGTDPSVDIVAIHGLNGHRENTWTHENGVLWLKDLLASDPAFCSSRIITYGYDGRTHVSKGPASLQSLPGQSQDLLQHLSDLREEEGTTRRPILFVVHSLGGIVLKSALVVANLSDKNESKKGIKLSTFGILFLGTPHGGSETAPLGNSALKVAQIYYSVNDKAIKELEAHSQWLERETGLFNTIRDSFRIRNCYELNATSLRYGPSIVIVPKWSAAPPEWDTDAVGINRDHISMTKFTSAQDIAYKTVAQIMRLMMRDAAATVKNNWDRWDSSRPSQTQPIVDSIQALEALFLKSKFKFRSDLPFKSDSFVGRDSQLHALRQKLSGISSRRSMVLFGPGGVGKTQLALKYCWDHKADHSTILWFNADNMNAMRASFLTLANKIVAYHKSEFESHAVPIGLIAQYLDLQKLANSKGIVVAENDDALDRVVDAVKLWLNLEGNNQWLAVFDSYEPDNFPERCRIDRYLPEARSGTIVVTTRRRIGSLQNGGVMEIHPFSDEESLQLLLRSSQKDDEDLSEEERMQATSITKDLGHFPLAIDQAGAYIFQDAISFAEYTKRYSENKKNVLSKKPAAFDSPYNECVFTTWETSYQLLKKRNEHAAQLLVLCSFLYNVDIPLRIFQLGFFLNTNKQPVSDDFSEILSFSLARRHSDDSYSIHPLIHLWARERFNLDVQCEYAQECLQILAKAVQEELGDRAFVHIDFKRRYRVHVDTATGVFKEWTQHLDQWKDLLYLHITYNRYDDAERICMLAWDNLDRESDPDTALSLITTSLVNIYVAQGRIGLAIALSRQCLDTNGLEHTKAALDEIISAVALHEKGRFVEAEKLARSGLATLEEKLGSTNHAVLAARKVLAWTLNAQERYDAAENEVGHVLDQLKKAGTMECPTADQCTHSLARGHLQRGDYTQALTLLEPLFETVKGRLGTEDEYTIQIWNELAHVHGCLGHMEEAEKMFAEVVPAREKALGLLHFDTLDSMERLADTYRKTGQTAKANDLYNKILERLRHETDPQRQEMFVKIQQVLEADRGNAEDEVVRVEVRRK